LGYPRIGKPAFSRKFGSSSSSSGLLEQRPVQQDVNNKKKGFNKKDFKRYGKYKQ